MDYREIEAVKLAKEAVKALSLAIEGYQTADYGSTVTDPLRDALRLVQWSLTEVLGEAHG